MLAFAYRRLCRGVANVEQTTTKFSHNKLGDTDFKGEGLREFFVHRDLGVAEPIAGNVLAQLVRAQTRPKKGRAGTITVPA